MIEDDGANQGSTEPAQGARGGANSCKAQGRGGTMPLYSAVACTQRRCAPKQRPNAASSLALQTLTLTVMCTAADCRPIFQTPGTPSRAASACVLLLTAF